MRIGPVIFLIVVFSLVLVASSVMQEPMTQQMPPEQKTKVKCPKVLIKKGEQLILYDDSNNAIQNFASLDEYIDYLKNERARGVSCPVLFLQQENDAQGKDVYRARPNPFDLQGGLPTSTTLYKENKDGMPVPVLDANRANKPYNQNNYHGFDPQGLYVGVYTEIDKIHDSTKLQGESDNPMDPNWGGVMYTQQMVDSGKYDDNNITKPLLFQPRGYYDPSMPTGYSQPKDILE